ncbi:MAG: sugar ABC transporter ATP-binding protein [Nocardioidaceae bacterium]|nr:sugar ABC transporter ATP-binding protein [Nocardioidaceae bacterium]
MDSSSSVALVGIHKRFGGVRALDDVSFTLVPGEVHALLGENGAGKSTLIKILTGVYQPDEGHIEIDGVPTRLGSPRAARAAGITSVPQDVVFVPHLAVGRNILLGLEGRFSRRAALSRAERELVQGALTKVGGDFSPDTPTRQLSVPQLRLAQLARALIGTGQVVVMDEPTAVLSSADADHLLSRLEALRDDGRSIVYVTHRLDEVARLADRISVLRNGQLVGRLDRAGYDRPTVIEMMTKRSIETVDAEPRAGARPDPALPPLLAVDELTAAGHFSGVSFEVRPGELLGIAGVQGSGQGSLLAALAGQLRYDDGHVALAGRRTSNGSVRSAYRAGMALVPADRLGAGVIGGMSIHQNLALPTRPGNGWSWFGVRRTRVERRLAMSYVSLFAVKCRDILQHARSLSGGNQQKVSVARAMMASPKVLLIDEPTQGVDVGAKAEIRNLLCSSLEEGERSVVIATSEFEDLIGLADRILVMRGGRVVGDLDGRSAQYQDVLHLALP